MATMPTQKVFDDIEQLIAAAHDQVGDIHTDLDAEWSDRGEEWQESDKGQDERGWVDEWDALTDKLSECQEDLNTLRKGPAK